MKTLILDCAVCPTVVIVENGKILASNKSENQRSCDNYMLLIDDCFKKANLTINDVEEIAVNLGPGSFTGLRVSVSIAKAFGFGDKIKFKAFTSFDYLKGTNSPILLEAFSNFVYIKSNRKKTDCVEISNLSKTENYVTPSEQLAERLTLQGYTVFHMLPMSFTDVLNEAIEVSSKQLMPLYLRKSQAEIQRENKLKSRG